MVRLMGMDATWLSHDCRMAVAWLSHGRQEVSGLHA